MTVVGEYTSKFDADLAIAMLWDAGLEGTVLSDPAHSVAPHHVTERMFRVIVRQEVAEDARVLLTENVADAETQQLDAIYHRHRLADRPRWFRWAAWALFWSLPGAFLIGIVLVGFQLLEGLFP